MLIGNRPDSTHLQARKGHVADMKGLIFAPIRSSLTKAASRTHIAVACTKALGQRDSLH